LARSFLSDYLQVFPFWLTDVGPLDAFSLPVLTPLFGFSQLSAPEISIDIETFKEGNWMFDRKVVKSGSVSAITMSRGVSLYESDFSNWIKAALYGDPDQFASSIPGLGAGGLTYRRTLMLIHFMQRTVADPPPGGDKNSGAAAEGAVLAGLFAAGVAAESGAAAGVSLGGALLGLTAGAALLGTPFEFAARIPARAYMLYGCVPSRYKAGSDFDATAGDMSIQELEVQVEMVDQISLL
jgi:hypothetical protein